MSSKLQSFSLNYFINGFSNFENQFKDMIEHLKLKLGSNHFNYEIDISAKATNRLTDQQADDPVYISKFHLETLHIFNLDDFNSFVQKVVQDIKQYIVGMGLDYEFDISIKAISKQDKKRKEYEEKETFSNSSKKRKLEEDDSTENYNLKTEEELKNPLLKNPLKLINCFKRGANLLNPFEHMADLFKIGAISSMPNNIVGNSMSFSGTPIRYTKKNPN